MTVDDWNDIDNVDICEQSFPSMSKWKSGVDSCQTDNFKDCGIRLSMKRKSLSVSMFVLAHCGGVVSEFDNVGDIEIRCWNFIDEYATSIYSQNPRLAGGLMDSTQIQDEL